MSSLKDTAQECSVLIRSGYPLLFLYSWEEDRVQAMWEALGKGLKRDVFIWTRTEGLAGQDPKTQDPLTAIREIAVGTSPGLFLLKDFHPYLQDPAVLRALRSALPILKKNKRSLGIVSPVLNIPRELEKDLYVVDIPLPTSEEIAALLDQFYAQAPSGQTPVPPIAEERESIIRSAQGLTLSEVQRIFARFLYANESRVLSRAIDLIHEEKAQILRRSRVLEFYRESKNILEVGGMDQLKVWLKQRLEGFSEKAKTYGLPTPKGLFLLGVQGCGKSLMAKAIADYWRMPLLRLDVAALLSSGGGNASFIMDAIKVAESLSPVVLWLDEIEKAFSGMGENGDVARNFGSLITWMQEKTAPVFVVATANSVRALPPELLRKGRFDEIFFVDLPNIHERKEILAIHLKRRCKEEVKVTVEDVAEKMEGYSGAEIEQVVIDAMFTAFAEKRKLTQRDLMATIEETVPLSTTMEEDLKALKEWARTRARRASMDTRRMDFFK